jgi:hypothetical protein
MIFFHLNENLQDHWHFGILFSLCVFFVVKWKNDVFLYINGINFLTYPLNLLLLTSNTDLNKVFLLHLIVADFL